MIPTQLLTLAALLLSLSVSAETILSPRSKAEHEADVKALRDKYGPAKDDAPALTVDDLAAPGTTAPPPATEPASRPAPASAPPPASAQRVRVTIYPEGERDFLYNGERYDTTGLSRLLTDLAKRERLDSLLLLEGNDRAVSLAHVVELAKLGKTLKLPTMYQQGQEFKSISAP